MKKHLQTPHAFCDSSPTSASGRSNVTNQRQTIRKRIQENQQAIVRAANDRAGQGPAKSNPCTPARWLGKRCLVNVDAMHGAMTRPRGLTRKRRLTRDVSGN
jgi:hypothetical protein